MKRVWCLILLAALLISAGAETRFEGDIYQAFRLDYRSVLPEGWEVLSYVEPEGLLLSAFCGELELTVSVDEAKSSCAELINERLNGVSRYGKVLSRGSVEACAFAGLEDGALTNYSWRLLRDEADTDGYETVLYAGRINDGYMLTMTLSSWGETGSLSELGRRFAEGLRLEKTYISSEYTAFLVGCEEKDGRVYLTVDYCDMAYENGFEMAYATNMDETEYTYALSPDAEVWLPELSGALYSLKSCPPQAEGITAAIEGYYALFESYSVYTLRFDRAGDVIRLQHYNALT